MIYGLSHWYLGLHMDDNGLPWYIDVIGGITDLLLILLSVVLLGGLV